MLRETSSPAIAIKPPEDAPPTENVTCGSCDDGNQAEAFCKECATPICTECNHTHKRLKSMKSHTILSLNDTEEMPKKGGNMGGQRVSCMLHPDEFLKYYCSTCSCLVCSECLFTHKQHDSARTDDTELMEKEKGELQAVLPELKGAIGPITRAVERISGIIDRVQVNKERAKEEINEKFNEIIEAVEMRRDQLMEEVESSAVTKCTLLQNQKDGLEKISGSLNLALESSESALEEYSPIEMLAVKGTLLTAANEIRDEAQSTSLKLATNSSLSLAINNTRMIELVSSLGSIVMGFPYPFTCCLMGINPAIAMGVAKGTKCVVKLQTKDEKGDKLTEGMAKVAGKIADFMGEEAVQCRVQDMDDGTYEISFTAPKEGLYQLLVTVDEKMIGDGPMKVDVRDYTTIKNPVTSATIQGSPAYIDIGPENLQYITLNKGTIEVYDNSKKVREIHASKLGNKPLRGIAVDKKEGVMFVATAGTHQIIKADLEGEIIASVGNKGSGDREFYYPMGLCLTKEGLLLVAEDTNKRVQVLNSDLSFVRLIPCLSNVYGVAVDANGNIHAAVTDRVEVFNIMGEKLTEYGQGVLSRAGDIAFLSDDCSRKSPYSFVADHISEGKVHMFDWSQNMLIHSFPMGRRPLGLAIDQEGVLIVGDWNDKKVHRF